MLVKGVATQNTPQRKEKPYYYAALLNCFYGISRAGWFKAAGTGPCRRNLGLVEPYQRN